MDQASQMEIVDLGDVKEQTKGETDQPVFESHPTAHTQRID